MKCRKENQRKTEEGWGSPVERQVARYFLPSPRRVEIFIKHVLEMNLCLLLFFRLIVCAEGNCVYARGNCGLIQVGFFSMVARARCLSKFAAWLYFSSAVALFTNKSCAAATESVTSCTGKFTVYQGHVHIIISIISFVLCIDDWTDFSINNFTNTWDWCMKTLSNSKLKKLVANTEFVYYRWLNQ